MKSNNILSHICKLRPLSSATEQVFSHFTLGSERVQENKAEASESEQQKLRHQQTFRLLQGNNADFKVHSFSSSSSSSWLNTLLGEYNTAPVNVSKLFKQTSMGQELGRGAYGVVSVETCAKTGEAVAMKTMMKADPESSKRHSSGLYGIKSPEYLFNEIALNNLCLPSEYAQDSDTEEGGVLRLFSVYESSDRVHITSELLEGQELFEVLVDSEECAVVRESRGFAQSLTRKVLKSVEQCHKNGVAHLDIKPENFRFRTKCVETSPLILLDFGMAQLMDTASSPDELQPLEKSVGSTSYAAPEVLEGSFSFASDAWSVGVVTYAILVGSLPWDQSLSDEEQLRLFKRGLSYDAVRSGLEKHGISESGIDFITSLLNTDQERRLTIEEALEHPWMQGL